MKDDVFSVYCEVLDLAPKWMDVGLMLGLEHSSLEKISTTYQESPRECIILCLMEVLEHWLKQMYDVDRHGLPTWKKMVEVTAHPVAGNDPALAATLARNHQGMQHTMYFSTIFSNAAEYQIFINKWADERPKLCLILNIASSRCKKCYMKHHTFMLYFLAVLYSTARKYNIKQVSFAQCYICLLHMPSCNFSCNVLSCNVLKLAIKN